MVTPITQRYLNFGELENSIMYFLCGIEVRQILNPRVGHCGGLMVLPSVLALCQGPHVLTPLPSLPQVICGFFLVRCLSTRLPDRVILVLGLIICNVACVWCLLFLARPQGNLQGPVFVPCGQRWGGSHQPCRGCCGVPGVWWAGPVGSILQGSKGLLLAAGVAASPAPSLLQPHQGP